MVFLLFLGSESIPPFSEYFADGAIVLVGVSLVHQSAVPFAEYHKGVHGPPNTFAGGFGRGGGLLFEKKKLNK